MATASICVHQATEAPRQLGSKLRGPGGFFALTHPILDIVASLVYVFSTSYHFLALKAVAPSSKANQHYTGVQIGRFLQNGNAMY